MANSRTLTMSKHASEMAEEREITNNEINACFWSGLREDRDKNVALHYDLASRIGVVVDWDTSIIITVIRLSDSHYNSLRPLRKAHRQRRVATA